jgi:hypothetical protein
MTPSMINIAPVTALPLGRHAYSPFTMVVVNPTSTPLTRPRNQ